MVNHNLIHIVNKPYKCDACGTVFLHRQSLIFHNRIHTKDKTYDCDICGKKFRCDDDLQRHGKVLHCGQKVNDCDNCYKTDQHVSHLNELKKIDSDKPIKCVVCGKIFSTNSCLKTR